MTTRVEAKTEPRSKLLKWARSEQEAITLQREGWKLAAQCGRTNHHNYSLLFEKWEDE